MKRICLGTDGVSAENEFLRYVKMYKFVEEVDFKYRTDREGRVSWGQYENMETEDSCAGCDCLPQDDCSCERDRMCDQHDAKIANLIAFFCGFENANNLRAQTAFTAPHETHHC
jgi:hypothetical protein